MPSAVKETMVDKLTEELKASDQLIITEYQGMKAEEFNGLRQKIRPLGAKYAVVKNRLAKIALKNIGREKLGDSLKGPSAIAYKGKVTAALAKILLDYSNENKKFQLKAGYLFGLLADASTLRTIAGLPSREVLLSTLLQRLNSPLQKLLATMNEPVRSLHGALSAVAKKKGENPPAAAPVPAA